MHTPLKFAMFAVLAGLMVLGNSAVRADEEDEVPSFKTSKEKESKEFAKKVGFAIVKAARSKPTSLELKDHEIKEPKEGRKELKIVVTWKGGITKVNVTSTMTVIIDAGDKDKWEVLNIDYKDDNKVSLASPSTKNIQALIKKFNK